MTRANIELCGGVKGIIRILSKGATPLEYHALWYMIEEGQIRWSDFTKDELLELDRNAVFQLAKEKMQK